MENKAQLTVNDTTEAASSRKAFPKLQEQFGEDPRVSYSKLDGNWILEDEDGSEWEFNDSLMRWMPSDHTLTITTYNVFAQLDEGLLEKQQEAYAVSGINKNVNDNLPKKRKQHQSAHEDNRRKEAHGSNQKGERKNTAIYVTGLPLDATVTEVASLFSKYGVIAEGIDGKIPRIKLYQNSEGTFKGDALIVYFRPESVNLAIQMLDDTHFRIGSDDSANKMTVREADFSYKKQKSIPTETNTQDRKKIIKKTQKLNSKLADWEEDDPSVLPDLRSKWDKVVILKHMFTLKELEDDPAALLDIKEDIREECAKLGTVTNVVLYDKEPDGVVSVRFADTDVAVACVKFMSGRHFAGQEVEAYIADGSEKYKKSKISANDNYNINDGEDDESKRLDDFGQWLEQEGGTENK